MTGIRKYIDIVENKERIINEGPLFGWLKRKPEPNIDARLNNRRKTVGPVDDHKTPMMMDPHILKAKEFTSADHYAYDPSVNQYVADNDTYSRSTNGPSSSINIEREAARLKKVWNLWKKQGYLDESQINEDDFPMFQAGNVAPDTSTSTSSSTTPVSSASLSPATMGGLLGQNSSEPSLNTNASAPSMAATMSTVPA